MLDSAVELMKAGFELREEGPIRVIASGRGSKGLFHRWLAVCSGQIFPHAYGRDSPLNSFTREMVSLDAQVAGLNLGLEVVNKEK